MNHACEHCGSEYTSALSAAICADEDREADQNTRQWFSNYQPHRKD